MNGKLKILAIPGSLREKSFNRALLKAAQEVAPDGMELDIYLLHDIPHYNADVEAQGDPEPVKHFKDAIAAADGVLFACPQYNRSIPGVLKNAVDWASRPAFEGPLAGKPCAIMGATPGRSATEAARTDLAKVLDSCRSVVMEEPQIGLVKANDHISDGEVISDELREQIRGVLTSFADFIQEQTIEEAAAD